MSRIFGKGIQVWGFDFVPDMVARARHNLTRNGIGERVWHGDITEGESFMPTEIDVPEAYDACIALGVFPHLQDDIGALKNMAAVTKPGGTVLIEFRNLLFSLFTINRPSYELICNELIRISDVSNRHPEMSDELEEIATDLKDSFRLDLPPIRKGLNEIPGYDEILSKFHNPFDIGDMFAEAGLRHTNTHFYHYHAVPPMFESKHPQLFRTLSLEMESDPSDWRGYFMASAFVAEAIRESN